MWGTPVCCAQPGLGASRGELGPGSRHLGPGLQMKSDWKTSGAHHRARERGAGVGGRAVFQDRWSGFRFKLHHAPWGVRQVPSAELHFYPL